LVLRGQIYPKHEKDGSKKDANDPRGSELTPKDRGAQKTVALYGALWMEGLEGEIHKRKPTKERKPRFLLNTDCGGGGLPEIRKQKENL